MRCSLRYNDGAPQLLEAVVAPFLPANASQAVPVSGASAATLEVQDQNGVAISGYEALTPAWDSTRKRLYYVGAWPAASFPLGIGYRAVWRYTAVTSGSSPEPRQEHVTYFDVTMRQIRPVVVAADLYALQPRLQAHGYTATPELCAAYINAAWEQLFDDVQKAIADTPHSLIDSDSLRLAHKNLALYQALAAIGAHSDAEGYRRDADASLRAVLATAARDLNGASGILSEQGGIAMGRMIR